MINNKFKSHYLDLVIYEDDNPLDIKVKAPKLV